MSSCCGTKLTVSFLGCGCLPLTCPGCPEPEAQQPRDGDAQREPLGQDGREPRRPRRHRPRGQEHRQGPLRPRVLQAGALGAGLALQVRPRLLLGSPENKLYPKTQPAGDSHTLTRSLTPAPPFLDSMDFVKMMQDYSKRFPWVVKMLHENPEARDYHVKDIFPDLAREAQVL